MWRKFNSFVEKILRFCRIINLSLQCPKIGKDFRIFGKVIVVNPANLSIGDGVTLNHGVYINAFNPVIIGDDVTLSAGAKILSTGDDLDAWIDGSKKHLKIDSLTIGNHVRIGANAVLLTKASIIGSYVCIAAGAVVSKPITESYVIVGGVPARIIKRLK